MNKTHIEEKRRNIPSLYYILSTLAICMALIISGCLDQSLVPLGDTDTSFETKDATGLNASFTGRDSLGGTMLFGVAFKANISGTWEYNDDKSCKILGGKGSATHLGRVAVKDQKLCVQNEVITEGEFTVEGRNGHLTGLYPHDVQALENGSKRNIVGKGSISAGLRVTDANIRPTNIKEKDAAVNDGWGWISIDLNEKDKTFTYQIAAWLHHNQIDVPGLDD